MKAVALDILGRVECVGSLLEAPVAAVAVRALVHCDFGRIRVQGGRRVEEDVFGVVFPPPILAQMVAFNITGAVGFPVDWHPLSDFGLYLGKVGLSRSLCVNIPDVAIPVLKVESPGRSAGDGDGSSGKQRRGELHGGDERFRALSN